MVGYWDGFMIGFRRLHTFWKVFLQIHFDPQASQRAGENFQPRRYFKNTLSIPVFQSGDVQPLEGLPVTEARWEPSHQVMSPRHVYLLESTTDG